MVFHKVCDDDPAGITAAILEAKVAGCESIFTTGGMSVDPDDRTPLAIETPGLTSSATVRRCCPVPCSWSAIWTVCLSAACRAA